MANKKWFVIIPALLIIVYVCGPSRAKPVYSITMPDVPHAAKALESYISKRESAHKLKPDNEARIVWYDDSMKNKSEYAIVYLHGFSASQFEGAPTHTVIAKIFGCNLYLSRLAEHGIDTVDALANLTADGYWESAKEALAIGRQLAKKVILMGTSTGGSNALQLAATYPDDVAALILLSPNIAINDPNAWILNNHWGKQIARLILGSNYNVAKDNRPIYKQYWNYKYRLEGPVALQEMLETTMLPGTFKKITQPVLSLYYYKDEQHQDVVVKVSEMKKMFDELSSPLKRQVAMPNTGDHVIGSSLKSKDVVGVQKEISQFIEQTLHVNPVIIKASMFEISHE